MMLSRKDGMNEGVEPLTELTLAQPNLGTSRLAVHLLALCVTWLLEKTCRHLTGP